MRDIGQTPSSPDCENIAYTSLEIRYLHRLRAFSQNIIIYWHITYFQIIGKNIVTKETSNVIKNDHLQVKLANNCHLIFFQWSANEK